MEVGRTTKRLMYKEQLLAEASIMSFYEKTAPTEVVTDASPVGLGAILVKEQQQEKRPRKLTQVCHNLLLKGFANRLLHLEGPVERELSLVGLKTMSPERLSEIDSLRIVT